MYFIIGAIAIVGGFVLTKMNIFSDGIIVGSMLGCILLLNGLYRLLVTGKSKLIFSKTDDALYRVSLMGRKKLIALSNIYDIITVSENMSHTYQVTNGKQPSANGIPITSFITNKLSDTPRGAFLKEQILPMLHSFLALGA